MVISGNKNYNTVSMPMLLTVNCMYNKYLLILIFFSVVSTKIAPGEEGYGFFTRVNPDRQPSSIVLPLDPLLVP